MKWFDDLVIQLNIDAAPTLARLKKALTPSPEEFETRYRPEDFKLALKDNYRFELSTLNTIYISNRVGLNSITAPLWSPVFYGRIEPTENGCEIRGFFFHDLPTFLFTAFLYFFLSAIWTINNQQSWAPALLLFLVVFLFTKVMGEPDRAKMTGFLLEVFKNAILKEMH